MGRIPGGRGMIWQKDSLILIAIFVWLFVLVFVALCFLKIP
jgi:hypothetical protein